MGISGNVFLFEGYKELLFKSDRYMYTWYIPALFHKGDNICDFLFAFLHINSLLQMNLPSNRKEFAPYGSKFFHFKIDFFRKNPVWLRESTWKCIKSPFDIKLIVKLLCCSNENESLLHVLTVNAISIRLYSCTSTARTSLEPWKFVLDIGQGAHGDN